MDIESAADRPFCIGKTAYGRKNPLIIAELGTSHGGDIGKAREMAAAAAAAGAGCVKLQMVFADEILHPNTGEVLLPGGKIRLYDRFRQLEMPVSFYAEMKDYIESLGLLFLCTPFGIKSARLLRELGPQAVKIASPELNFTALLREVAGWGLPALLSTGVSKLADIEEAVAIMAGGGKNAGRLCLLHCVTAYPAPETEYNLKLLETLSAVFGVSTGLSDHSLDPCLAPVLAVTRGAAVIEKHFCLSRDDPGLDDPIALPPEHFAEMVQAVRATVEAGPDAAIAEMKKKYGAETVNAVLGDGVKQLAPCEKENYERTNRSLHSLRDIQPGEIITTENSAVLRTEKTLRPGLPPSWAARVYGRTARQYIPTGEGIRFEDI